MLHRDERPRRRSRRFLPVLAAMAILVVPALPLAGSIDKKIANGHYSTVEAAHVPGGEDVEFNVHKHAFLKTLFLGCAPNAKLGPTVEADGAGLIYVRAEKVKIDLKNGRFSYSGPGAVTPGAPRGKKIATDKVTIKGRYILHGKKYHYMGTIDNKVTATLVFSGTASSPACAGLPKGHVFRNYTVVSVGGD